MDAQTRMILYYLNAMGQGLAGKDHPMQQVGAVTEQQIKAESQMKLIQKLLDGGGTVKRGKTGGIDLSGDMSSLLAGMSEEEKTPFAKDSSGKAMNAPGGQIETQRDLSRQDALNPSPSPTDVSGADLIGLTPENISQALQFKFMSEELEHKKLSELMKMMQPVSADPLDQPFIGGYTLREFNALTSSDKEYAMAKEGAKKLGDSVFMSKREWEETEPTERQRFLKGLEGKPEMLEMEKKLAAARHIPSEPSKPAPMNISTATKALERRFGKLDPTGMWAITPELQSTHRKAQELLVDFTDAGMDFPRAVNKADTQARGWKDAIEKNYSARIAETKKIENKSDRERMIEHIKGEFYRQYKYIPSVRRP